MNTMRASHSSYDNSVLDDTEFALAISPCPRIEGSQDIGAQQPECSDCKCERSGPEYRRVEYPRHLAFDEDGPTEVLTIGWAIALASAAGLVIYVSGV